MFCTECGQQMADEAKFCAFCGTRRAVAPVSGNEVQAAAAPPKPDVPGVTPPPPVRAIRSTAEIMPIRVRPVAPPPLVDELPAASEPGEAWPEEESAAPPMYVPEPPVP